jgi:HSP20 family protein
MTPWGHEGIGEFFFDRFWPEWRRDLEGEWTPTVNFFEKDGSFHLTAEVPGINKEDISVTVNNGIVTLSGKKESEKEEKNRDYYLKETRSGSFSRSFRLPGDIDETKVDATYKDGVLTVVLPRKEESKAKKIEVH